MNHTPPALALGRCLPDYRGNGIVNLMGSLVLGLGGTSTGYVPATLLPPSEIEQYQTVVLVIVDGLGDMVLDRHRRSCLFEHRQGRLTSVFPSTTASAITTFLTGVAPQQHGITGWHMYFRELGAILATLPGTPRYGGVPLKSAGVDPVRFFNQISVFDRVGAAGHVVAPRWIIHSDFNRALCGQSTTLHPYDSIDGFFSAVRSTALQASSRSFIYAYWSELDHIGHTSGIHSSEADWHFRQIDKGFERLLRDLNGSDALLIVTADHGFIDAQSPALNVTTYPELADCLSMPLCGEPRAAYCYLRPDRRAAFESAAATNLGDCAEIHVAADLIAQGWFGLNEPHPALASRIGDYVMVMKSANTVGDWLTREQTPPLAGVHGGISEAEMWVPLILANRR